MSARLKDRGGGGGGKATAAVAGPRPLTPKPFAAVPSARRTPAAAGKENSASKPSKPTSVVRWSTSSLPRASRIQSSVESSKLVSTLRAAALPGSGRPSLGKDPVAEAGLRRSVSGGIRASVEKGRRSVGAVSSRVPDARRGSGGAGADGIGRRKEGFDAMAKGFDETSRKRDSFGSKGKQTAEISRKRESFDAKAKQISGKRESFAVNVTKQCDEIKGKTEIGDASMMKQSEDTSVTREGLDPKAKSADEASRKKQGLNMQLVKEINPTKADSGEAASEAAVFSGTQKNDKEGNSSVIPVFTVHVVESNDVASRVRVQQPNNEECKKWEEKGKLADKIRVFEEASGSGERKSAKPVSSLSRYPSKLHEKLAALEGRVQKIATEIKKTKEMLDDNNPDEPKQILSNIQDEITAIEKAISHVKDDNKIQLGTVDSSDCESSHDKRAASCGVVKPGDLKHAGKGMNTDELEARFFPHHKLLRDRRSSAQQEPCVVIKKDGNEKLEAAASGSNDDENSIAMEFLASLDGEENEFFKNRRAKNLEKNMICEVADATSKTSSQGSSKIPNGANHTEEIELLATEKLEEFDETENKSLMMLQEETEESSDDQLSGIGNKSSTGGWFVSEGEAVLLAHGDGTCSYYDIANHEFKSEYKPPSMVSNNMWGDCWLIRAPGVDGCSGRYVVAASAGNALEPGFCTWDYYSREVKAFHIEQTSHASDQSSRSVLDPLSNVCSSRSSSVLSNVERQQWWYRPCGPLLLATASKQKMVTAYDIRDGDVVMNWEVSNPVVGMEYSSPLQWRSRGKVVIAGSESIGLWDVNSLNPQPLLSVASSGKKVYCLHVNNTDAEVGGGVRQRVSSSEVEGNDGVFSTQESLNVFDFRVPAGIGLKIARHGGTANSIFSRGDSVFIGSTEGRLQIKGGLRSRIQQYSLRKGKLVATYELPEFNCHFHHSSITQVWGNSNLVLAACGMGLFAFDTFKEDTQPTYSFERGNTFGVREAIGPEDLYCPTFDYSSSRVLLVSRDRPALWRYLS
ncbi:hypothetical protein ACP4OV_001081 [Aristida adscensionis]